MMHHDTEYHFNFCDANSLFDMVLIAYTKGDNRAVGRTRAKHVFSQHGSTLNAHYLHIRGSIASKKRRIDRQVMALFGMLHLKCKRSSNRP